MFGQCPAKIGSWPLRYLWTNAGGSLAGKRQDFYLPLPPLSGRCAAQDREGRKYVSQRALSRPLAASPTAAACDRCSHDAAARLSVVRCPSAVLRPPAAPCQARLPPRRCPVRPLGGMCAPLSLSPLPLTHLRPVRPGGCILAMPIPPFRLFPLLLPSSAIHLQQRLCVRGMKCGRKCSGQSGQGRN